MGSPLSLSQSITLGIASNTEMVMPKRMGRGGFRLDGEDVGALVRWIAHDAVIYPGNSGGPLISMKTGRVIGINTTRINNRHCLARRSHFVVLALDAAARIHHLLNHLRAHVLDRDRRRRRGD